MSCRSLSCLRCGCAQLNRFVWICTHRDHRTKSRIKDLDDSLNALSCGLGLAKKILIGLNCFFLVCVFTTTRKTGMFVRCLACYGRFQLRSNFFVIHVQQAHVYMSFFLCHAFVCVCVRTFLVCPFFFAGVDLDPFLSC